MTGSELKELISADELSIATRRLAREIPDAKLVLLEGAGHMPMLERREEFGRAVAQFCADVQGRRTL